MAHGRPLAVTDTSPVIALTSVGQLRLVESLFERFVVPFEVWGELLDGIFSPEPQEVFRLSNVAFVPLLGEVPDRLLSLHRGEQAAIASAHQSNAWVVLDEARARKVAAGMGLHVVGTLGILVRGKRMGLVAEVRPLIDLLLESGFRLGGEVIDNALKAAGEG